jgi:hypothetical protein
MTSNLLLVQPNQWLPEADDGGFPDRDGIGREEFDGERRQSISTVALLAAASTAAGLLWTFIPVLYDLSGWSLIGCVLAAGGSLAAAEVLHGAVREHPCLARI